jgi:hypothetical protein
LRKLLVRSLFCLGLALLSPLLIQKAFFRLPTYSPSFDCDDAATMMIQRLNGIGLSATPMLGNLKMTGEKIGECDHVWVLVRLAGIKIALDRGAMCVDRQHYEGYVISDQQLATFVQQDLDQAGQIVANPSAH